MILQKATKKYPTSIRVTDTEKEDLAKLHMSVAQVWFCTMRVMRHVAQTGSPPPCIYLNIQRKRNERGQWDAKGAKEPGAQAPDPCSQCPAAPGRTINDAEARLDLGFL
jgi:hypothetical protein